jgi:serine/threonine protein kinase
MPKHTRKSKRGGKFKGEGTYGCGFFPSLKCIGQPRTDKAYLSKMITNKGEAEKEFAISTPIAQIDPTRNYFITAESMCNHDQSNIRPNNETHKCKKFPLEGPTYLIMYEDGGENLSKLKVPANLYSEFFVGLMGLIVGLVKLHSSGMVHLDIKPDNIVGKFYTDLEKYKIRYIDFGLSRQLSKLIANDDHIKMIRDFNLKTPYPYYPFDTIMTSLERQRIPSIRQEEISHWYKTEENRKYNTILPQDSYWKAGGLPKYTGIVLSAEYMKTVKWYTNLSDHLKSIDMYGLAVSLCEIYKRVTGHIRAYDEYGNIIIAIFTEKSLYRINDTLKKDYGDEIYNFHKNLAVFSMRFYEELIQLLVPFGNLRPTASSALKTLGPLLSSTDELFKNPNLTYKALSALGVNLEKPVIISQSSLQSGVTNITPPHSLALSETNNNLPPGWERHTNDSGQLYYYDRATKKSQWERPPPETLPPGWEKHLNTSGIPYYYHRNTNKTQWIRPPIRPKGEPTRIPNPVTNMKMTRNPLQNITKLTQFAKQAPKKRTRKNRRSN